MLVDTDDSPPTGQYHADYVERVAACLMLSHERYKVYYQLASFKERMSFRWLNVAYTANNVSRNGTFYPVILGKTKYEGAGMPRL